MPAKKALSHGDSFGLTLLEFFTKHDRPRLASKNKATTHRQTIGIMKRAIGRTPQVIDLNTANLEQVLNLAWQENPRAHWSSFAFRIRRAFLDMAKLALELGMIDKPPKVVPVTRNAEPPNARPGELSYEFDRICKEKLGSASPSYVQKYRNAIAQFDRYMRRPSKAIDATTVRLEEFATVLIDQGMSERNVANMRRMVSRVAGWIEDLEFGKSTPGTLAAIFEEHRDKKFTRTGKRLSRSRRNTYRAVIGRFSAHVGHDATPSDLTAANLESFTDELAESIADATVKTYVLALRRIARFHDAKRFPDRRSDYEAPAAEGTLRHFFEQVYTPQRMVGRSPAHMEAMNVLFRMLRRFHRREVLLEELNDALASKYFGWLLKRGLKPITINGHRARLLTVWRFAFEKGAIATEPRVGKLAERTNAPDAWNEDEIRRIIAATLKTEFPMDAIDGIPTGKWFRAFLLVGYWTALCRGAIFKLRWADVNTESGWLTVPGEAMKNGRGKTFRLGRDALEAMEAIRTPPRNAIFPFPHGFSVFDNYLGRIIDKAGIEKSSHSMPQMHKLRRSVATLIAKTQGISAASDLLGHSDVYVTRRYIDETKMPGQDATTKLPDLTGDGCHDRSPAEFQANARLLAEQGHLHASGMLARVALEREVKDRYFANHQNGGKAQSTSDRIRVLLGRSELTMKQAKQLFEAHRIANKAAHGGRIDRERLEFLLSRVDELLAS